MHVLLLIVFFQASSKVVISTNNTAIKLAATLSNIKNHPCQQPLQHGNCSQKIPLFYYNNHDHKCRKFIYSGCNGNENRFLNRRQCYAKCGRRLKFRMKQSSSAICNQPFNPQYRKLCRQSMSTGPAWVIRYFYDIDKNQCRRFWYGSCKGTGNNRNIFPNERACKLQCIRKKDHKSEKTKNTILKKTTCFLKFDKNLRYGCKTFDWRPRFFYNQTSSKCEMFWYDASCSKRRPEVTNMFYHRGACQRLCEQSQTIRKSSQRTDDTRRIGQISAMFSQPYNSMKLNSHRKLIRMSNIFDDFLIDAHIKPIKATVSKMANTNYSHASFLANSTPASALSRIHVTHTYIDNVPTDDNTNSFDFHILRANLRRFFQKVHPRAVKEENNVTIYHFNQFMPILSDKNKSDILSSVLITRCLEPLQSGNCLEMIPAYYYNRKTQRCEPFIYSGCNGNSNRFRTLRQCQTTCRQFRGLSPLETNCLLSLDGGDQFSNEKKCTEKAGIRYYYNQKNGPSLGNTGNGNRFYDLSSCETVCQHIPTKIVFKKALYPEVCFEPITEGKCLKNDHRCVEQWAYNYVQLQCVTFNYNECNENQNRFATEYSCNVLCEGLKRPLQDECFEPLDRGRWCQSMFNRYYYNFETNTCTSFHYTGYGKSRNIFTTQQEYHGVKSLGKQVSRTHQISMVDSASYIKSDTHWLAYGTCIGYRYNITGETRQLKSYFCLMELDGICHKQILSITNGDEKCRLVRPWLKGIHLYS